jgi:hypothetical protein
MPDIRMCMHLRGCYIPGTDSSTSAGTGHKSRGLHCHKIRAASMRLELPHQRVKTVKLDSANISMRAIERSKEI